MARITRKQLKSDKFALEVEHTVTFFDEHRTAIIRYGAIALVVIILVSGYSYYAKRQHNARQAELAKVLSAISAPVGAPAPDGFPTQQAKDQQVIKLATDLEKKGHEEGDIAGFTLAGYYAEQGKIPEAEKLYKQSADEANAKYASLSKLSLAQIYFASGRASEAEKLLRDLIQHPTVFVTSDQATIALARGLSQTNPQEARKLLDGLASKVGSVGQIATALRDELPQ